tara:strand:- start:1137 stop:1361 length:225 start_codon:yes stop_codon:yes gene_type:complete
MVPQFIWAVTSYTDKGGAFVSGVEDPRKLGNTALKLASLRAVEVVECDDVGNHIKWANLQLEQQQAEPVAGGQP